jgi:hypothetical protein
MEHEQDNKWMILAEDVRAMIPNARDESRKRELELAEGVFQRMGEHNEPWPRKRRKKRKTTQIYITTRPCSRVEPMSDR